MFARGVSRGIKTCASTPARAAYAASAPPAFPALGTASLVAPRCFAIETATLIPRALKLCVGLSDSSLIQRSTSSANLCADSSGVHLRLTTLVQHRWQRQNFAITPQRFVTGAQCLTLQRSTRRGEINDCKQRFIAERQRFCRREDSCSSRHELHS